MESITGCRLELHDHCTKGQVNLPDVLVIKVMRIGALLQVYLPVESITSCGLELHDHCKQGRVNVPDGSKDKRH